MNPKDIATALHDHEKECASRYERTEGRLARLETDISWIKRYQWLVLAVMIGGIVGFYIEKLVL